MFKIISFYLIMLISPLLILEFFFRLLPVSHPPYILPVNEKTPVAHFELNKNYTWSSGWNFSNLTQKHSNNFGFINKYNYQLDDNNPLMMIIGDSFVESNQTNNGNSSAELLHGALNSTGRIYSMGVSGSPLSQYLAFAEYAHQQFQPEAMTFFIVGNDFDESWLKYKTAPRLHYFVKTGDTVNLTRIDYSISTSKELLRNSALIRYIMFNVGLQSLMNALQKSPNDDTNGYVGNVPKFVDDERLDYSKQAIDVFLKRLPEMSKLPRKSILFVLDGMRPSLYDENTLKNDGNSYFSFMRHYFYEQATAAGYEVVDMQQTFIDDFARNRRRFEFPMDNHWNEYANQLVANRIKNSVVYKSVFVQ